MRPTICSLFEPHHKHFKETFFVHAQSEDAPTPQLEFAPYSKCRLDFRHVKGKEDFFQTIYTSISVYILVDFRRLNTSASGVAPATAKDSRKASCLPGPEASTQTSSAAAIAL